MELFLFYSKSMEKKASRYQDYFKNQFVGYIQVLCKFNSILYILRNLGL
jgi:hypothetical protein